MQIRAGNGWGKSPTLGPLDPPVGTLGLTVKYQWIAFCLSLSA